MKIQNFRNLNLLKLTRKNFTTKSHLQLIAERDNTLLEKFRTGSNFTKDEMGEFARVLNKSDFQLDLWQKYEKELPKHIKNFDELELRKAISLVISKKNQGVMQGDDIVDSLSARLDLLYTEKDRNGLSLDEFKTKKRLQAKGYPLAYKFYIKLYNFRCSFFDLFKNYGISSK